MFRNAEDLIKKYNEHMRGGGGTVEITNITNGNEELNDKGRLFAKLTLNPGCGVGYHVHEGESEIFYIIKGTAEYSDNGEILTMKEGDMCLCPAGTGHSITNNSDEVCEFIALILYA